MDKAFETFVQNVGSAISKRDVDPSYADSYSGRLPARLIDYWKQYGYSGYGEGIFWTVDPADYHELLNRWLERSPFKGTDDYHVIARTAFGKLYVWGTQSGLSLKIDSPHSIIFPDRDAPRRVKRAGEDLVIEVFFKSVSPRFADFSDTDGKPLFAEAKAKLGQLASDEIYGFVPTLALGGKATLSNLRKVKIFEHLEILVQIAPPRIMESPLGG